VVMDEAEGGYSGLLVADLDEDAISQCAATGTLVWRSRIGSAGK
jgi:hypothetical protein